MIESVELENIQSHKKTIIHFKLGLNTIKGPSHKGKSVITKAIKANITNTIPLDLLRSWSASDKDPISCKVNFDDCSVERRKEKKNQYIITEGDEELILEAMKRSEVPEEVLMETDMSEINIQSQFDGFFMLQDAPGDVAKEFNKAAGLEIIDETVSKVNSIVSEAKKESKLCKRLLKENAEKIKTLDYLKAAGKQIAKVDKLTERKIYLENRILEINNLVTVLEYMERGIEKGNKFLTIEPKAKKLEQKINQLQVTDNRISKITGYCNTLEDLKLNIKANNEWLKIEDKAVSINLKMQEAKDLCFKRDKIKSLCDTIEALEKSSGLLNERRIRLESKLRLLKKQQMKEAETCPKCGSLRKYWKK